MLWPSHLLVRYAGAPAGTAVSFTMADFHSATPPPERTREQALELAKELAQRARANPERFAELVRRYSDDEVRRDAGGSLGGIPAAQLAPWPEVLDALTVLEPGQISQPVETWYGFHILQRRAPPPADVVSGRRIVIGHARARFLRTLAGGLAPTRSREDALRLARAIYERAKEDPERFAGLVERHSELRDRVLGGDFGTWSNLEPCPFPREVEVLDRLEVGEVAPPFDSLFGIEIVQRVANFERSQYAIDGLRLYFDPDAPETDPNSRAHVLQRARVLNQKLIESPDLLPELQAQHSRMLTQFEGGRGSPEVHVALAQVNIGSFIAEPVQSALHYVIGRRVAPTPMPKVEPIFELPAGRTE